MKPIWLVLLLGSWQGIIARGPPVLLPETPNLIIVEADENHAVELRCPVKASPDLSVQWSKNNDDLDPMWSTSNLLIRRFLLKIHQAQANDAGFYKCSVVNGFGHVQAHFRVNVHSNGTTMSTEPQHSLLWDMDSLQGEAPEFLSQSSEPTKIIQPEGTTAQLKCLATGKPTPDIRWKKNGKILSEDEYGITQSQILNIKDLRQSDSGNYTCEVFNSLGTINATYVLTVTEKLQFFGNDPENISVDLGQAGILNCRVQTNDRSTRIQWLRKIDRQELFRADAIVFGSEQYEAVERSPQPQLSNNVLSKPLVIAQVNEKTSGEYICLIQNDRATNYKKAFITLTDARKHPIMITAANNLLVYVIVVPLFALGLILVVICCVRRNHHRHRRHTHCTDTLKSSTKPRQPLIHPNGVIVSSRTSTDYLAESVDCIPVTRHYQQARYGPGTASDLASLTSSNLYYARVQAL